jgi:hypothetical protein
MSVIHENNIKDAYEIQFRNYINNKIKKALKDTDNFEYSYDNVENFIRDYADHNKNFNVIMCTKTTNNNVDGSFGHYETILITKGNYPVKLVETEKYAHDDLVNYILSTKDNFIGNEPVNGNLDTFIFYMSDGEVQEIGNSAGPVFDSLYSL